MTAIAGWKAQIYLTSPPSVALTNDVLTNQGDNMTYVDQVAGHKYLDPSTAVVVQTSPDGVTWTTVTTGFMLQFCEARVIFAAAQSGTLQVRLASGKYFPTVFLANAKEVAPNLNATMLDSTSFQNPPSNWKTIVPSINDASFKLSKFWADGFMLAQMSAGQLQVINVFMGQNTNQRLSAYGYLKSDGIKGTPSQLVTEDVDFEVNGHVYPIYS